MNSNQTAINLEETILIPTLLPQYFDSDTRELIIRAFMRYIDDGIMELPKSIPTETFLEVLNLMHPLIQYTVSTEARHLAEVIVYMCTTFLSIKVLVDPTGGIEFDVSYKETNAHDYLAFDSHHPEHTKNNIPYVLAKRIIVMSTKQSWVERNLRDLKQYLLDRKYPAEVINKGFYNASLQGPAPPKSSNKVLPLITPFLGNLDASNIVGVTRDLLQASSSERLSHAFKDTKIVQCYTQTPNLLKTLSSSRFTATTPDENCIKGVFHCTNKRCLICAKNYLQECQSFVTSNGTIWRTKCHITCNSLNVIYFLKCNYCHEVTKLGKTDNLRERTNNHISGCRNGKGTDVFDNHVFNCCRSKGLPPSEPFFLLFCLMACNDYHKLLNIERKLHLKGYDTVFKLL